MGSLAVSVAEASACTLAGCLWCPSHGCSQGVRQAHSQDLMEEDKLPSSLGVQVAAWWTSGAHRLLAGDVASVPCGRFRERLTIGQLASLTVSNI